MDARKPRLTTQLLDDLSIAVESLDGEIAYLAEALNREDMPLSDRLREGFKAKHTAIVRSREWLSKHIDATRSQRADDADQAGAEPYVDRPAPAMPQSQPVSPVTPGAPGTPTQTGLNFQ